MDDGSSLIEYREEMAICRRMYTPLRGKYQQSLSETHWK
jgi:hypothetical protein